MGYYSGNGVVTGGGHNTRQFGALVYGGAHIVFQKTKTTITVKNGVSLATAQAAQSSCTVGTATFSWANIYPWVGCFGLQENASYQQINGSNLYALTIENKEMTASGDGGRTWLGPT